jgi:hypothetical protein
MLSAMAGAHSIDERIEDQPELVFGLIGALGAGLASVGDALRRELREVGYRVGDHPIKLSHLMHRLPGLPFEDLLRNGKQAGVETYMDAGTALRERLRPDGLALFAVSAMRRSAASGVSGASGWTGEGCRVHPRFFETSRRS